MGQRLCIDRIIVLLMILFLHVIAVLYAWLTKDSKYIIYKDYRSGVKREPSLYDKVTINTYLKPLSHFSFSVK